jgi:hypothetical protein
MGFNTFRGDIRTFAVILLAPAAEHALRVLRHEPAWRAACSAITPLDVMTSTDYARPITDVMPMGGLMNVDRTGDPGVGHRLDRRPGAPSVASVDSTAPPSSTTTMRCTSESRPSSAGGIRRRRQARPVRAAGSPGTHDDGADRVAPFDS